MERDYLPLGRGRPHLSHEPLGLVCEFVISVVRQQLTDTSPAAVDGLAGRQHLCPAVVGHRCRSVIQFSLERQRALP